MYNLEEIAQITGSTFVGKHNNVVNFFLHDSRMLQRPEGTLFIALKSGRNNGHVYIEQLIQKGVRSFLIKQGELEPKLYPEASFIVSDNPLICLQNLAKKHRSRFNIPVIGITGSNGKTMVKEWLYQSLKDRFVICRSPRSYNSQIGVPLSVLSLNEHHTLAIFEAGISTRNEMAVLEKIIQPTMGVLTSIGSAHDEGFFERAEKIGEKFLLFDHCSQIVVNGISEEEIPPAYQPKLLNASRYTQFANSVSFQDQASLENAATCSAVLDLLGLKENQIREKLQSLQPVALRLEMRNGTENTLLINDYYNSDLDSVKIALNYLTSQNRRPRKIVILSDIEQSGIVPSVLYKQLAELIQHHKADLLIGVGKEISKHRSFFHGSSLFFDDAKTFVSDFRKFGYSLHNATILLKGARSAGFESISRILQQKSHDTVFEINLNRLIDNVNYYRSLINNGVMMMGMVKATGYGSGGEEIARTLQNIGINYLAVAYADEGVELRESLITLPIMVMNPEEEAYDDIISFQLEPEIYSMKVFSDFRAKLDAQGITQPFPVHIKIDTGMHRLGFLESEMDALCAELKSAENVRVVSVFSHLAASDNSELDSFTKSQIEIFETTFQKIISAVGHPVIRHICNSGGISRFPQAHYEMVRLGIGMYGLGVDALEQKKLHNVGTLRSRISQIKQIKAGETIGYNRAGVLEADGKIAIVPIGYADGFGRMLGNGHHGVFINGEFCKTVGNICMDMCMVNVSSVNCKEGDEVIIFSNVSQIASMAKQLNTISYEVLTGVSARVKRIYVQE